MQRNQLMPAQKQEGRRSMNKVLVIDDDKELCALMKKCVEQESLVAVVANGGIEELRISEIALLADDIGIIDHAALLEEESLAELEAKSSRHIRFTVSSITQAARILEQGFHETQFTIQDFYMHSFSLLK